MPSDKTLTCKDCGAEFIFTASEQDFYAQKGFMNEPSRCPNCRQARKGRDQGGRGRGGMRSERTMYDAVCTRCGAQTQVPFQPKPDREILCRDCFRPKGNFR
jgi:CxxC-x17-CxxC domain-containing protein